MAIYWDLTNWFETQNQIAYYEEFAKERFFRWTWPSKEVLHNLKITLQFQEDNSKRGLLNVDYSGKHRDPHEIKRSLPDRFKPYVDKWFDYHEHHIHYYVEGYNQLAWAIPLADDFPVKSVANANGIFPATRAFARKINLKKEFKNYQDELVL